ncbi:hypothetical protein J6590_074719 [Homalodisca vitripennis]|nr:hypothetical protein J6590_074719 [Homalodisca vitripennis]
MKSFKSTDLFVSDISTTNRSTDLTNAQPVRRRGRARREQGAAGETWHRGPQVYEQKIRAAKAVGEKTPQNTKIDSLTLEVNVNTKSRAGVVCHSTVTSFVLHPAGNIENSNVTTEARQAVNHAERRVGSVSPSEADKAATST